MLRPRPGLVLQADEAGASRTRRVGALCGLLGCEARAQDHKVLLLRPLNPPHAWQRCATGRWIGSKSLPRMPSRACVRPASRFVLRSYPHNWPYSLNLSTAPWDNKLVRQAANYAIDRVGLCKSLLNDTCIPENGVVYPGHPWYGNPKQRYEYDPARPKNCYARQDMMAKPSESKAVCSFRPPVLGRCCRWP